MSKPSPKRPPNPTLRWVLMLAGVIVVFGGVFAIKAFFAKQTDNFFDNMPQPAVAVSSAVAKVQRWSDDGEAVGTFVAVNGTDVTTEAGGVVRSIAFEAGQPVAAGTVLLRLNTANEQATLDALEASARLARVQANRWQQLGKEKLVSLDDVQSRVTAAATAQAQVDAQRALIAQKTIRAPFSGVLGLRKVNLGQYIAPGAAIVSLQQLDPIHLDFSLPEQRMGKLVEGSAVRAGIDALPGQVFEGQVTAIEPQVDPATRNFKAQATFRNPDGALRPGSFASITFAQGGERDVLVIPQTAVSFNPYGNAVFVIGKQKRKPGETDMQGQPLSGDKLVVTQRFVKTGATRGDLVVVSEGLKAGEQVVTSGLLKLRNDAEVTINDSIQPAADARPTPENR
ncbi:MAG TPA: efflux RND transporter periplasmic adaptor subunit [Thermomonas sp.]|jgi:membrane fusion protein (multidrug efflux system)|uniref:efflux RND transporter periplasmic adaptor subunit n=1 Tax=Thermomonas sp. TaxID=1971895 RepID=UPI002D10AA38|nr:efflux RND transporter periplasmic adaptor subunit [Thermomonas sp.]HQY82811.1 efflux RND transporter periplasmic adaptor subunit [Thermomonas sp.]HRA02295.1 efflux RND transporter periplasmic adaptor subunit [Thermomonas sp.]